MIEKIMAKLRSEKKPPVARVRTMERAEEIIALCNERGWKVVVGIKPDKPEGISNVEPLHNSPAIIKDKPKVGRNDPCPCGSGLKFKKCCLKKYD